MTRDRFIQSHDRLIPLDSADLPVTANCKITFKSERLYAHALSHIRSMCLALYDLEHVRGYLFIYMNIPCKSLLVYVQRAMTV